MKSKLVFERYLYCEFWMTPFFLISTIFNSYNLYSRFASAKKCSNEGRALMQLDFQQYLMKLEKLTDIR